ncbi:hypothetical protein [Spirosoma telluris]|uniref:hypothetical protein n=1 Tax=Spirosoma telluris TaxID=2183553 RepID=UPI002FC37613
MPLTDQLNDIINSLGGFGPEVWLSASFCVLLVIELFLVRVMPLAKARRWLAGLSVGIVVIAGAWAGLLPNRGYLFTHLLFVDNQAIFSQIVIALSAAVVLLYEAFTTSDQFDRRPKLPLEWYSLLIAMTLGLFMMSLSVNLLSIYLSIELVSICSYLLTALTADRKASEGGLNTCYLERSVRR